MDQHEADAEVGRLLREARERWPKNVLILEYSPLLGWQVESLDEDEIPAEGDWTGLVGRGPTPAAALRALLEGGQHDAG
jgi:hypothetical protein